MRDTCDRPAPARAFGEVLEARLGRRALLGGSLSVLAAALLGACGNRAARPSPGGLLGFASIEPSKADTVRVPEGYRWQVVNAWGDPIMPGAQAFAPDAGQGAEEQAEQAGMGHDGMHFFALPAGSASSEHGLIAINYEHIDEDLLFADGRAGWSAEKLQKAKNAHGLGVFEVRFEDGRWRTVADSVYGRRITADTPMRMAGPAAGHALLRTAADPDGILVQGTFENCASGRTPWGTYLACEEHFAGHFVGDAARMTRLQRRYDIPTRETGWGLGWEQFDERFDAALHPNEPNRFGWVVEIDPYDRASEPVKRTALGRMAHEGATLALARDGRVVYYMGDDGYRSKFEHIYKFVSRRPHVPGADAEAQRDLLDEGTLYAARFDADGSGEWLALEQGANGLVAERGFASQAEVLIDARSAADTVGATFMDRPEWIAVHPQSGEVYATLTGNPARGREGRPGGGGVLGADAANPRAPNRMGHILRWREAGGDAAATRFEWDVFLEAGDARRADPLERGNVKGGIAFAQPDGCCIDARGVLWIQTDASARDMASGDWARIGNNQMLAADPASGEVRRFLTGPAGCEVTGLEFTPDMRSLFVNIQHPGEPPAGRNDPARPMAFSSWPDGPAGGRPRSATIAIRRIDGGIVGT